jgi:hypothetical protein
MATKPKLNTDTSVVDYLKSTGKGSDFATRSKLAAEYGITGYTGDANQNTLLLQKLKGGNVAAPVAVAPPVTSPANVTDPAGAHSFINDGQQNDFDTRSTANGDTPPVKTSTQTYAQMFADLKASVAPTKRPESPNFVDQYEKLLKTRGVIALEETLNTKKAEAKAIKDANAARKAAEGDKPVAMNVIAGRQTEEDRQDQLLLDPINADIERISNELTTKYKVVDNIMAYSKLDYASAVDEYDTAFTQNLNLFNTVKGIAEDDKSANEREQDNARANLQIIYNNISSGGADLTTITAEDKASITKLELQAGLPVGFYNSLQVKNPKADILSTTTRETGGTKYADVIMKNADGSLSTKTVVLGKADGGSNDVSNTELLQQARAKVSPQIQAVRGGDGYVAPENYVKFRDAWTNTGLSAEDFDKNFKQYANPESYAKLGISF